MNLLTAQQESEKNKRGIPLSIIYIIHVPSASCSNQAPVQVFKCRGPSASQALEHRTQVLPRRGLLKTINDREPYKSGKKEVEILFLTSLVPKRAKHRDHNHQPDNPTASDRETTRPHSNNPPSRTPQSAYLTKTIHPISLLWSQGSVVGLS